MGSSKWATDVFQDCQWLFQRYFVWCSAQKLTFCHLTPLSAHRFSNKITSFADELRPPGNVFTVCRNIHELLFLLSSFVKTKTGRRKWKSRRQNCVPLHGDLAADPTQWIGLILDLLGVRNLFTSTRPRPFFLFIYFLLSLDVSWCNTDRL